VPFVVRLIVALVVNAIALALCDWIFDGVAIDGWGPLLIAAAVLGVINAIIRPVLVLFSIPLIVITLGLFLLLINIALLALTDWIVSGFDIEGFWTYVGSVIVLWVVNTAADLVTSRD
jgi:putative membrane protein